MQSEDALKDYDVGRVDCRRLGKAGVLLEGVYGNFSHFAVLDVFQALDQDIEVYSVW